MADAPVRIRLDKIRCIVVFDLSRLGRNLVEGSDVIDMLLQRSIRLIVIRENIDTIEMTPGLAIEIDLYNLFNAESSKAKLAFL